jgi:hypothetical protein
MGYEWRKVAGEGKAFAAWVEELHGKSGCYAIKWDGGWLDDGGVMYVGESHTGRLYETFTRHFQAWSGPQSGVTWDRRSCEACVEVFEAGEVKAKQVEWIADLNPRENRYERPDDDNATPF